MSDKICPTCSGPKSPTAARCTNCRVSPLPPTWQRNLEIYEKIQAGWQDGKYYGQVEAAREYRLKRQAIFSILKTVEKWKREGKV